MTCRATLLCALAVACVDARALTASAPVRSISADGGMYSLGMDPTSRVVSELSRSAVATDTKLRLRGGGATLSRLLPILLGKKQCRILMLGLDAAGKTTILYQLKLGEMTNTAPTLGFNVETVKCTHSLASDRFGAGRRRRSVCHTRCRLSSGWARAAVRATQSWCLQVAYKNIEFMVWDMGGQDAIRQLWSHYYKNAQALIFVVDSADEERLAEAREELQKLMGEEVR